MLYKLYNHRIYIPEDISHLGIPLASDNSAKDITIYFSTDTKKHNFLDNQFELNDDYGFYYRKHIGFFEFLNGESISIQLEGNKDPSFFQTLFNFPFACIFAQNGFLPIHASAVRYNGKTILFPGITKKGKSSLAALLIKLGGKLITEDIALFRIDKNECKVLCSYPLIKLSDEINNEIEFSTQQPFKLTKSDLSRSMYKLKMKDFFNQESQVNFVIFPNWSNDNELKSLSLKESLIKMISCNFFTTQIENLKKYTLNNNLKIIKEAKCFEYKRARDLRKLKSFKNKIEDIFD